MKRVAHVLSTIALANGVGKRSALATANGFVVPYPANVLGVNDMSFKIDAVDYGGHYPVIHLIGDSEKLIAYTHKSSVPMLDQQVAGLIGVWSGKPERWSAFASIRASSGKVVLEMTYGNVSGKGAIFEFTTIAEAVAKYCEIFSLSLPAESEEYRKIASLSPSQFRRDDPSCGWTLRA